MNSHRRAHAWALLTFLSLQLHGGEEMKLTRDQIIAQLAPYAGPSVSGVDTSTLTGKVVTGYQGWFNAPGDGSARGWVHYGRQGRLAPGACNIEVWPDMGEYGPTERFPSEFRLADGSVAEVFSSYRRETVLRHFDWMRQYGIDGALVQRFANETRDPKALNHRNAVLRHAQEGANRHGRGWALMYDLSGLRADSFHLVLDDWRTLVERMRLGRDARDKAYLRHRGKPLVAVWGVGFNDDRGYTLADCEKLIDLLKDDPVYGGNTVMLGVPYHWRERKGDAIADVELHRVLVKADIISPWAVGRFGADRSADDIARKHVEPDVAWCRAKSKDYLPVVWPGFSWHNLRKGEAKFDQIPRLGGDFMWRQCLGAKRGGADMLYVAMFDELDEGTAIFKCSNAPPVGGTPFLVSPGLPSDHYLWLTGMTGRMLSGEIPATAAMPVRPR